MSFYNTGNPVPSNDPRDLDDNAKHLDEAVTSTLPTFIDRKGATRRTWTQIEGNFTFILTEAQDAAAEAVAAAEVAQGAANIFNTTALGLAATTNGQFFSTPSADSNEYTILYRNDSGVATRISELASAAVTRTLGATVDGLVYRTGAILRLPRGPLNIKTATIAGTKFLSYISSDGIFVNNNPAYNYSEALNATLNPNAVASILSHTTKKMPRGPLGIKSALIVGTKYIWTLNDFNQYVNPLAEGNQLSPLIISDIGTGQSLSLGSRGFINTTVPGGVISGQVFSSKPSRFGEALLMLQPQGVRVFVNNDVFTPPTINDFTGLAPMYEQWDTNVQGETIWSGYARALYSSLIAAGEASFRMLPIVSGRGNSTYPVIKKGTTVWDAMFAAINAAKYLCEQKGLIYRIGDLDIMHGESETGTSQAVYKGYLLEWLSDFRTDAIAVTGQTSKSIRCTMPQMNTGGTATEGVVMAQVELHETDPDFCLYTPKYQFKYYDGSHMIAEGYVKTGELRARAKRFLLKNKKWDCLRPVSAVLVGSVVTLTYNNVLAGDATTPGPIGALALSATMSALVGANAGFFVVGGGVTISSVALGGGGTTVVVTLSGVPSAGCVLKYAMGEQFAGAIRDSDTRDRSSFDGTNLYNFSIAKKFTIS